ncbi:hypothetical protein RI129_012939 [Pyrocoelia pectoralis]|uniref:Amine oxidase domain-containing protein n=1 Tax=Pyrocoelia pectoralis TaxID=417401 RepID=A0AAN7V881_9COLE
MYSALSFLIFFMFSSRVESLNDPSVIIIGAGAAGISAATRLHQNGIRNVTVLEAGSRIGGRIHSVKVGESYIDLGAQWCHGEKNNVVYDMVKNLNLLKSDKISPRLYHSKLKLIDKKFDEKFNEVFEDNYFKNLIDNEGNLGDLLIERFKKTIPTVWQSEHERSLAKDCVEMYQKLVLCNDGAFSWFNLSAKNDYEISDGDQELGWNGLGFKTILDILMQNSSISGNIILNKEVSQIIWNGPNLHSEVVVNCVDGTTYTADHVITTVSLGVLKDRHISLFKPHLSTEKVLALETLGIDAVSSIFLYYPNKWWNESFEGVSFVWSEDEIEKTAEAFPIGPTKGGRSWITAIVYILPVLRSPNILAAWYVGEFVPEIESSSNDTIIKGITYTLNLFLGQDIPRPEKIIRHKWYSDPHFRGSYSFETVESRNLGTSQAAILSQPISREDGKLAVLFAGEATNPIRYATVHGAIETGFREADRIVNLYNN